MNRLRAAVLLGGFVAMTVPLMPLQQLFKWTWPAMAQRFPHLYHRQVARLLGFRITIEGEPPKAGPTLLVSNHVSWIDIVAFSAALPVSFVAKREVGSWPMFGQLARLQRTVFVNRERRHATGAAHSEMTERLRQGDTLMLFPEGTSHDGINMLPFKSSFFGAAELEGVQIVPVTIAYTQVNGLPMTRRQRPLFAWYGDMDLPPHLWQALQEGPIGITIKFHAPLRIAEPGGRKQLARQSEGQIRDSLARLLHGR